MKSLFVFSDLHYPNRTKDKDLLGKLEKLITENDITIGCGDYVSENIIELVQHTAKNYFLVKGNMDFFDLNLPQMISIKI
ncbi:MAG: metallophosphoesterase, partial [Spirochaetota bacterium]